MYEYILDGKKTVKKRKTDQLPPLKPDEALVEICYVCLCGSDYRLFQGTYSGPVDYPIVPGHEWSGKIVEINTKDDSLIPGAKVTGDCSVWGEECIYNKECFSDKNICPQIEKYGITKNGFLKDYAIVPVRHLYRGPDDMPIELLAMAEIFSVANNAILKSGVIETGRAEFCKQNPEKGCLVIGLGAVGLCVYLLLRYKYGITNTAVSEISRERIDLVKQIIPDIVIIDMKNLGLIASHYSKLLKPTPYSHIIEATGTDAGIDDALKLINPGGVITLGGMYKKAEYNLGVVVLKSVTVSGSIGGTGSFLEAIEFINQNQDLVKEMISSQHGTDDLTSAFDRDQGGFIKKMIMLKPEMEKGIGACKYE